jgi:ketosteroid isomerase-like protein
MRPALLALLLLPLLAPAQTKSANSITQTLIKLEHEWSEADVKKDAAALNRILAEDWIGIDFEGVVLNKTQVLEEVNLKSDVTATQSTQLGEMTVRIFGNTALVSGTEKEKSQYQGRDSSGTYIWTDVFVLRNGRWQAVSSQSTKVANP